MALEDTIRRIAQQVHDENATSDQFAVAETPFHTHNGSDTPRINFSYISQKVFILPHTLFGTQAATAGNYSTFFTAPYAMTIMGVTEVHAVAGTDLGAVTLDVEKLTGTTAPGSGTKITAAPTCPFNLKGAINTVVTGTLSQAAGVLQLAAGDRLALLKTGTLTAVANVTITMVLTF